MFARPWLSTDNSFILRHIVSTHNYDCGAGLQFSTCRSQGRRYIRACRPFARFRAGSRGRRHFAPVYCVIPAFSAVKPGELLSIMRQSVQFRVKAVFFNGHFVPFASVFIHIPGGCFISNISTGQRPGPDLESHTRQSQQSAISRPPSPSSAIF